MSTGDTEPLYKVIYKDLLGKIENEHYCSGDKIPTEKELMNQYKTSRITASRAVKELENRNYVRRVKASGTFVTDKTIWEEYREQQTKILKPVIAAIIPSPASNISIEMEVLQGIGMTCRKMGYAMTIYSNDSDSMESKSPYDFEKGLISELIGQGAVGAIIFPSTTNESPEIYNMMARKSFPFVLLDRQVFGVEASLVTSDNKKGFYSVVEHVISKGHKRIAFVSGNTHESSCRTERFYGFVKAMNDYKLEVDDQLVIHHLFPEGYDNKYYKDLNGQSNLYESSVIKMFELFFSLENPPTAIVTSNDYIALNIISVATNLGYKIPDDISITGFDGLSIRDIISPKLTTVAQDFLEMGHEAIRLLHQLISNPQLKIKRHDIPTKLLLGQSVKDLINPGSIE